MKIQHERKVQFRGAIGAGQLAGFIDSIPDYAIDRAVVRVSQDTGGGTPTDPGGLITLTATWDTEGFVPPSDPVRRGDDQP